LAIHELLQAERAVVLWLVPSNTILDQTADALRTLASIPTGFGTFLRHVEVLTIEEACICRVLLWTDKPLSLCPLSIFPVLRILRPPGICQNGVFRNIYKTSRLFRSLPSYRALMVT